MRTPMAMILIGALVTAGCGNDTRSESAQTTARAASTTGSPAEAVTTEAPSDGIPLFVDTFTDDSNLWGEVENGEFGTIDIVDGDQRWIDATGRVIVWGPGAIIDPVEAGELDLADVTIRAAVTLVSGTGVIGVGCRVVPDTDSEMEWYDFVVRDGYAAIRRADAQSHLRPLAEANAAEVPFGEPVVIEATCRDDDSGVANLTLALNGELLLEATDDDPIGNGWAAPVMWTFPVHSPMEVHWHEFSVFEA